MRADPDFEAISKRWPLTPVELEKLEADIVARGCLHALVTWDGILVDGYHRWEICKRHKIKFDVREQTFDDRDAAEIWALETMMMGRRNLGPFQKGEIVLAMEHVYARQAKARQVAARAAQGPRGAEGGRGRKKTLGGNIATKGSGHEDAKTRSKLAVAAGVSPRTMGKIKVIHERAPEPVKASVRAGDLSIDKAYSDIKRTDRLAERKEKCEAISEANAELPIADRKWSVIYADPPWRYEHVKTESRAIENQYPTMDLDAICALDVPAICADDAILFLWATSPKLAEAMRVVESWGFTYRTCAVWDKQKIGMGYYFRQQHELLLVAIRGAIHAPEPENRPASVISDPRSKHSAKPEVFYGMIERMYPDLPRVELFARKARDGWDRWGNQS